jgi:hypothetical protein
LISELYIYGCRVTFEASAATTLIEMPYNASTPHSGGKNGTDVGKNATAIAAAAKAAKAQMLARHRKAVWNQKTVKYYAAAMTGVIILFTIFHWSRFLYSRYAPRGVRNSRLIKAQVSVARYVETP